MILVSIYNSKTSKSSSVDVIQSLKEYKIIIFKLFSDHLSRNKFFLLCSSYMRRKSVAVHHRHLSRTPIIL